AGLTQDWREVVAELQQVFVKLVQFGPGRQQAVRHHVLLVRVGLERLTGDVEQRFLHFGGRSRLHGEGAEGTAGDVDVRVAGFRHRRYVLQFFQRAALVVEDDERLEHVHVAHDFRLGKDADFTAAAEDVRDEVGTAVEGHDVENAVEGERHAYRGSASGAADAGVADAEFARVFA